MRLTPQQVSAFALTQLQEPLDVAGVDPTEVGDDFDLVGSGVLDSLGMMELIMAVNEHFQLDVDYEGLDPAQITVLGSFSRHVASAAGYSSAPTTLSA